jgi:hypothetical protein
MNGCGLGRIEDEYRGSRVRVVLMRAGNTRPGPVLGWWHQLGALPEQEATWGGEAISFSCAGPAPLHHPGIRTWLRFASCTCTRGGTTSRSQTPLLGTNEASLYANKSKTIHNHEIFGFEA